MMQFTSRAKGMSSSVTRVIPEARAPVKHLRHQATGRFSRGRACGSDSGCCPRGERRREGKSRKSYEQIINADTTQGCVEDEACRKEGGRQRKYVCANGDTMKRLEQIYDTYAWYQSVGNSVDESALARFVRNVEHPNIWVANHMSQVRAGSQSEIDQVLQQADRMFAHCSHRMAIVDSFTPDPFIARLSLHGFTELTPTLQMVLDGPLVRRDARASIPLELHPVVRDEHWQTLYGLARANHLEGSSSHHRQFDEEVTRRMVAQYQAKASVSTFFLALCDGAACGYGSAVVGPLGIGVVEDLFTAPAYRRRGVATAIIARAVEHARGAGMGPMLIGPHATEPPKALYAALGFVPQGLTRQYLLEQ
jgi:GNAT superfamily N-acetyltransferase